VQLIKDFSYIDCSHRRLVVDLVLRFRDSSVNDEVRDVNTLGTQLSCGYLCERAQPKLSKRETDVSGASDQT
jgi:hypothetical protein